MGETLTFAERVRRGRILLTGGHQPGYTQNRNHGKFAPGNGREESTGGGGRGGGGGGSGGGGGKGGRGRKAADPEKAQARAQRKAKGEETAAKAAGHREAESMHQAAVTARGGAKGAGKGGKAGGEELTALRREAASLKRATAGKAADLPRMDSWLKTQHEPTSAHEALARVGGDHEALFRHLAEEPSGVLTEMARRMTAEDGSPRAPRGADRIELARHIATHLASASARPGLEHSLLRAEVALRRAQAPQVRGGAKPKATPEERAASAQQRKVDAARKALDRAQAALDKAEGRTPGREEGASKTTTARAHVTGERPAGESGLSVSATRAPKGEREAGAMHAKAVAARGGRGAKGAGEGKGKGATAKGGRAAKSPEEREAARAAKAETTRQEKLTAARTKVDRAEVSVREEQERFRNGADVELKGDNPRATLAKAQIALARLEGRELHPAERFHTREEFDSGRASYPDRYDHMHTVSREEAAAWRADPHLAAHPELAARLGKRVAKGDGGARAERAPKVELSAAYAADVARPKSLGDIRAARAKAEQEAAEYDAIAARGHDYARYVAEQEREVARRLQAKEDAIAKQVRAGKTVATIVRNENTRSGRHLTHVEVVSPRDGRAYHVSVDRDEHYTAAAQKAHAIAEVEAGRGQPLIRTIDLSPVLREPGGGMTFTGGRRRDRR